MSRDEEDLYRILDRLARGQRGLVATRQLLELGLSREAIRWLTRSGRLIPVRRGVFRTAGAVMSWRGSALAAVLAAGGGAVLSHRSAGVLWALLDRSSVRGAPLDLNRSPRCRIAGVTCHGEQLNPSDVTRRDDIPVTTVERTLLDLAESHDAAHLGKMIDAALRRRLTTMGRLAREMEQHAGRGRHRFGPMRQALADRGAGYDPGANDWELGLDRQWERMGLPEARRQYRVRVAGGRTYIPDRVILDARMTIDWNGYEPHGYRSNFDADSERRALLSAAGWHPLDFTSRSSPKLVCETVLKVYAERCRLLPSPAREPHLGHPQT